jgi:hypothetical protein
MLPDLLYRDTINYFNEALERIGPVKLIASLTCSSQTPSSLRFERFRHKGPVAPNYQQN